MNNGLLLSRYYALAVKLAGYLYSRGEFFDNVLSSANANASPAVRSAGENISLDNMCANALLGIVAHASMDSESYTQGEIQPAIQPTMDIIMASCIEPRSVAEGIARAIVLGQGVLDAQNNIMNTANARSSLAKHAFGTDISCVISHLGTQKQMADVIFLKLVSSLMTNGHPLTQQVVSNFLEQTTEPVSVANVQVAYTENLHLDSRTSEVSLVSASTFGCPVQVETDLKIVQTYTIMQNNKILEVK